MKKFRCKVERIDEYIIEFDENIIDKEFMEDYKKYFADFNTLEEHAENIAQFRARFGDHNFIEGYGVPLVNSKNPKWSNDESDLEKGINIRIISEDQDCVVDVEEIQ